MGRPRKGDVAGVEATTDSLHKLNASQRRPSMARGGAYPGATALWGPKEFDDELARCRRAWSDAGNLAALFDALILSGTQARSAQQAGSPADRVLVPLWALDAAIEIVRGAIPTHRGKGGGRHARWVAQFKQDTIDYMRWDAVEVARDQFGASKDRCFALVAAELDGTAAAGSEDKVRRSWEAVKGRIQREPGRYYFARYLQLKLGPREVL